MLSRMTKDLEKPGGGAGISKHYGGKNKNKTCSKCHRIPPPGGANQGGRGHNSVHTETPNAERILEAKRSEPEASEPIVMFISSLSWPFHL